MLLKPIFAALCLALIAALTGCKKDTDSVTPDVPARQAGYVVGKATDAQGKPLANVEVLAYNT